MLRFVANQTVALTTAPFAALGRMVSYTVVPGTDRVDMVQVRRADGRVKWFAASELIRVF